MPLLEDSTNNRTVRRRDRSCALSGVPAEGGPSAGRTVQERTRMKGPGHTCGGADRASQFDRAAIAQTTTRTRRTSLVMAATCCCHIPSYKAQVGEMKAQIGQFQMLLAATVSDSPSCGRVCHVSQ